MRGWWALLAVVLPAMIGGWLVLGRPGEDSGAVFGALAAGGWGLGLVPVHSRLGRVVRRKE